MPLRLFLSWSVVALAGGAIVALAHSDKPHNEAIFVITMAALFAQVVLFPRRN